MPEYKAGDEVWYTPPGYEIIIKCKIIEVDDEFRKEEPQAYLFYDLDEPVGHNVDEDEVYPFSAFEEAVKDFKEEHRRTCPITTLDEYRKRKIYFIVGTWEDRTTTEKEEDEKRWYGELPPKVQGVDWFNATDIFGMEEG